MNMSRSCRKPWVTDGQDGSVRRQFAKRAANKTIRRYQGHIPNGKAYRKLYNPWDICDWRWKVDAELGLYGHWQILRGKMTYEEAVKEAKEGVAKARRK